MRRVRGEYENPNKTFRLNKNRTRRNKANQNFFSDISLFDDLAQIIYRDVENWEPELDKFLRDIESQLDKEKVEQKVQKVVTELR